MSEQQKQRPRTYQVYIEFIVFFFSLFCLVRSKLVVWVLSLPYCFQPCLGTHAPACLGWRSKWSFNLMVCCFFFLFAVTQHVYVRTRLCLRACIIKHNNVLINLWISSIWTTTKHAPNDQTSKNEDKLKNYTFINAQYIYT